MLASTGTDLVYALIAVVILIGAVALWRVSIHNPKIVSLRWGIFYERDVCDQDEEEPTEQERHEKLAERKTYH
jgi:hypothetical protein